MHPSDRCARRPTDWEPVSVDRTPGTPTTALQRPLALLLSGGGAQGAAQAGAAIELRRAGILPDFVVGTSVGAWNGAWVAMDTDVRHVERLEELWLDRELVRLFHGLGRGVARSLLRRRIAALDGRHLRALVGRRLGLRTFASLAIPLTVSAVDIRSGELVHLDRGDVASAVLAASAIPVVLPPVEREGRVLVDAGFVDNFGVAEAIRRGARSLLLIDASIGAVGAAPRCIPTLLDRANLVTRIHQRRVATDLAAARGVSLSVIEVAGSGTGVLDFRSAPLGLRHGRAQARAWLAAAGAEAGYDVAAAVSTTRPLLSTTPFAQRASTAPPPNCSS